MDLGIGGKTAIVCAAGTDLGEAAASALAREGVEVTNTEVDEAKAGEVGGRIQAATGGSVTTVVCDITTPDGRAAALAACPAPDILINHAPGPPMGDFRDWSHQQWLNAVEANMLTAIELIKATLDPMIERGFGRIVNITSQSVRAPMANLDLSNAARSGLTGFVAGVARHPRGADVTINNLLPGTFETAPLKAYIDNQRPQGRHRCTDLHRAPVGRQSSSAARQARGIRCVVRIHLQSSGGVHQRPEHPDRRRQFSRHSVVEESLWFSLGSRLMSVKRH